MTKEKFQSLPTPRTDAAILPWIAHTQTAAFGDCVNADFARSLERRAVIAERKLKFCAGLVEHWRMQSSVTSRRSAWSANGALEKCAVELEKALALDQIGKESNE